MNRNIREEILLNAEEEVDLIHMSEQLGICKADVFRVGFRQLKKQFIKAGLYEPPVDNRVNHGEAQ